MSPDAPSMTMMKYYKTLAIALILGLVIGVLLASLLGKAAMLSALIGYGSAAAVTLSSFRAYQTAVQSAVQNGAVTYDLDRDTIDRIDDPYELDDEAMKSELTDPKEAYREAKAALKANRRSLAQTLSDSKPAFSPWRLGAYAVLVIGFFYLKRHEWLHLPVYLVSLALPMMITVGVLTVYKQDSPVQGNDDG